VGGEQQSVNPSSNKLMKTIFGSRKERFEREISLLAREIGPQRYKLYRAPFPDFMTEPGSFKNNLVVVGRFDVSDQLVLENSTIKGTIFEYCYIRDDRDVHHDEATKHINIDRRVLCYDSSNELVQGSFKNDDHLRFDTSTSMASIAKVTRIKNLEEEGNISRAIEEGLIIALEDLNASRRK